MQVAEEAKQVDVNEDQENNKIKEKILDNVTA